MSIELEGINDLNASAPEKQNVLNLREQFSLSVRLSFAHGLPVSPSEVILTTHAPDMVRTHEFAG